MASLGLLCSFTEGLVKTYVLTVKVKPHTEKTL